jgi:hypothetical protein
MKVPARMTVTCDEHGEPIVFGAQEGKGCVTVDYVRADVHTAALNALRTLARANDDPLPATLREASDYAATAIALVEAMR